MQIQQYFRQKFEEIKAATSRHYTPHPLELKKLDAFFEEIISTWDKDLYDDGPEYMISRYSKFLGPHKEALEDMKYPPASEIPDNNNKNVQPFFLSAFIKLEEFFIEYLKGLGEKKANSIEELLSPGKKPENKFIRDMSLKVVYDHFKVFVEKKNKKGEPYLTMDQLLTFIRKGFLGETALPQVRINQVGEKSFVLKRFYEFYTMAISDYSETNKKDKHINLILNCFDNWDYNAIEIDLKPNRTKRDW